MKLPNWFKIVWWIILLGLSSSIVFKRYEAISSGQATTADIFLLAFFVMFLVLPLFAEFEFLGIKLKKEIDNLKDEIRIRFGDIQSDIRNSQSQTIHNTFSPYGLPPSDREIPALDHRIETVLSEKLRANMPEALPPRQVEVPKEIVDLFETRYKIEKQLRILWSVFSPGDSRRLPLSKTLNALRDLGFISADIYEILREILAICNIAIHGDEVTKSQANFVSKNADRVLEYLRN